MQRFLVVLEKVKGGYSAYVPDVPGCVATGETVEEAAERIQAALQLHLEGLREDGEPIPRARSAGDYVIVD